MLVESFEKSTGLIGVLAQIPEDNCTSNWIKIKFKVHCANFGSEYIYELMPLSRLLLILIFLSKNDWHLIRV